MVKKSLKGGEGRICPIVCTTSGGIKIPPYPNRVACPSWFPGATMEKNCNESKPCPNTMEPAERCINDKGEIIHGDKTTCRDDTKEYWGYACVNKNYTKGTHNMKRGGKNKKKQTKKSKKHMKKTKKNRRK